MRVTLKQKWKKYRLSTCRKPYLPTYPPLHPNPQQQQKSTSTKETKILKHVTTVLSLRSNIWNFPWMLLVLTTDKTLLH